MGKEYSPNELPIITEAQDFLKAKYPIRPVDTKEILEQMHSECRDQRRSYVVSRHVDLAIDFANQYGLQKREKGNLPDVLYVPGRLAGIVKFENEKGSDLVKQLPLSRYLGILAIGEVTSIRRILHQGWRSDKDQVEEHLSNFNSLISLQEKLQKASNRL
jgi:hypothetical protein